MPCSDSYRFPFSVGIISPSWAILPDGDRVFGEYCFSHDFFSIGSVDIGECVVEGGCIESDALLGSASEFYIHRTISYI